VLTRQRESLIGAVTLARPSLDDVYLRHAGRAFHQADTEGQGVAA
jgi:ABC-2 type transport system ATP-binding protein